MSGRFARGADRSAAPVAQLSLLDRLIDEEPDKQRDPPQSPAESMVALRRSLRRDLEALLNARRRWRSWPESCPELGVSPVSYGISDFSSGAFNDPRRREWLRTDVEQTIRRFEPRLVRVRVTLMEPTDELEARLHLRIEGLLRVEPAPEPIAFDTLVDAATAEILVKSQGADVRTSRGDNV
jgi:type VI secretion system protein ImpF